ncbi:MAG: SUMF1/EgtB/PvdO family nonheme iron enzyme [Agriterribacter sp.]
MKKTRRHFLKEVSALSAFPFIPAGALHLMKTYDGKQDEGKEYGNIIEAPEKQGEWPAFIENLQRWRNEKRMQLSYTGSSYADPAYEWASKNYCCCFLMMYDLDFYDVKKRSYTIDTIIERGKKEFGGYDSVVLWHAYPRIGIDERNQFDFYEDMPGGLPGLQKITGEFHSNGLKVFINYNPWDTGTRRASKPDIDMLIDIVAAINADGIFLDTMKKAESDFRQKLDQIREGIVLEGELAAALDILATHHLSWAQEFEDGFTPGLLRNKWFERRHMQHQIFRWNRDHSQELHQAWMNGSGMMVWENVFGQWIAWSERDKSILKLMLPVQRRYHEHFITENWTPWIATQVHGVFAGCWEKNNTRIWTLVNRLDKAVTSVLLKVDHIDQDVYYDLISGTPAVSKKTGNTIELTGRIAPRSIACFIAGSKAAMGDQFEDFLLQMRSIKKRYNDETGFAKMQPVLSTAKSTESSIKAKGEMVEIKKASITQTFEFVTRECGALYSYPEGRPNLGERQVFQRKVEIKSIAVDIYPVTNVQYYAFIQATRYQPAEKHNFLKHWQNNKPPAGKENHPVVYIDLDDARAYAKWLGKRLPLEQEWQFAAQGVDQKKYPWGDVLKDDCYNAGNDTTPVDEFPAGASPFGCMDMCGNIWEMTESEYTDRHTRFCILKGGSYFEAKGSIWYTNGGVQPAALAAKFLILYPGLDRCATIGFRCVTDL